jgi:hypothetical protein
MNEGKKKVHFTKIRTDEALKRINNLKEQNGDIIIWLKGRAIRETYTVSEIYKENRVKIYPKTTSHLANNSVLIKFSLGGQNYFTTADFKKDPDTDFFILHFNDDFYKSERRSSYRLLVYPTYDVKIYFLVQDSYQGSNIVDINTGQSETGIFKSFLKIMGQGEESEEVNEIFYRVQDLSTSGVSFVIGSVDDKYFKEGEQLHDFKIVFDGEEFIVSGARVVYVIDYIQMNKKGLKQFKVGLEFDGLSTTMDSKLGKKITDVLRKNEANEEFEDFIK